MTGEGELECQQLFRRTRGKANGSLGEFGFLSRVREWTRQGCIGDDGAVLPGGLVVTTDVLVEGRRVGR